jgi:hypothetical protein
MILEKFVKEIELIVYMIQVIEMKSSVLYHNDHQQKDLIEQISIGKKK